MKKLLMTGVAALALITSASGAKANDLELGISGYFLGYGVYNNQDEPTGTSFRGFDLRKETEIHVKGETTLDNGLTVGVAFELDMDRANGGNTVEESYAYMSGEWGKFIIGEEHSAARLLQVEAPSADPHIDGALVQINSVDLGQLIGANTGLTNDGLFYTFARTGWTNKVTYITPIFSGFQAGVSYTPSISEADQGNLAGITTDNDAGEFDDALDVGLRFQTNLDEIDLTLGAGYTNINREAAAVGQDDRSVWNLAADADWGPFGLGIVYFEDDNGIQNDGDTEIFVVGADYTHGDYKFGASYQNRSDEQNAGTHTTASDIEVTRWTGGVTYSYAPGVKFRSSLAYIEGESGVAGDDERSGYQISLGTQINF